MTTTTTPTPGPTAGTDPPRKLIGIVLGLVAVLTLMLLAFAAPALNSGPEDLPLAVSGPEQGVTQVTRALEKEAPGTFEVTRYDSADEAAEAVRGREAIGGIAVERSGITVQTASGAGTAYTQLLTGLGSGLEQSGQQVSYDELAQTTDEDPSAMSVTTLGLPLVFGGMATAALLTLAFRGSFTSRLLGAAGVAVLGGLVASAVLQFGFDALDGPYWEIALAIAAGIFAISATMLGLAALLGTAGIGIGALLMLLVANPLSGLPNGPEWLPQPWGDVGQMMPVGAAGSLVRSVAFFDGGGATTPTAALAAWILGGVLLGLLGGLRRPRTEA